MLQQIVIDLAICDVVCPFQMLIKCIVIRRKADYVFLFYFVPSGRSSLPTNNTRIFTVDFGQDECFHIGSDFVS